MHKAESVIFVFLLWVTHVSCAQNIPRNIRFFENTPAMELAMAVGDSDLKKIKKIVRKKPELLEYSNPVSGSNVLALSMYLENYSVFRHLLALGADPNFKNGFSRRSMLMEACKYFEVYGPYSVDPRYLELLLEYGADPNYVIDSSFTDEKGYHQRATSPLIEASRIDLGYVKLLVRYGADAHRALSEKLQNPLGTALEGGKQKYLIANFLIDSLGADVHKPMYTTIRQPGSIRTVYYIQDYIIDSYARAVLERDTVELNRLKLKFPQIEEDNQDQLALITKLGSMGVDFLNYDYARTGKLKRRDQ